MNLKELKERTIHYLKQIDEKHFAEDIKAIKAVTEDLKDSGYDHLYKTVSIMHLALRSVTRDFYNNINNDNKVLLHCLIDDSLADHIKVKKLLAEEIIKEEALNYDKIDTYRRSLEQYLKSPCKKPRDSHVIFKEVTYDRYEKISAKNQDEYEAQRDALIYQIKEPNINKCLHTQNLICCVATLLYAFSEKHHLALLVHDSSLFDSHLEKLQNRIINEFKKKWNLKPKFIESYMFGGSFMNLGKHLDWLLSHKGKVHDNGFDSIPNDIRLCAIDSTQYEGQVYFDFSKKQLCYSFGLPPVEEMTSDSEQDTGNESELEVEESKNASGDENGSQNSNSNSQKNNDHKRRRSTLESLEERPSKVARTIDKKDVSTATNGSILWSNKNNSNSSNNAKDCKDLAQYKKSKT